MLTRLLWRPWRPSRPHAVYYLLGGGTSFLLVLAFTLNQVYYVTVVGLSPLQMVLVGTVLEATCFLFEIPTGVRRRPLQPPPLGRHRRVAPRGGDAAPGPRPDLRRGPRRPGGVGHGVHLPVRRRRGVARRRDRRGRRRPGVHPGDAAQPSPSPSPPRWPRAGWGCSAWASPSPPPASACSVLAVVLLLVMPERALPPHPGGGARHVPSICSRRLGRVCGSLAAVRWSGRSPWSPWWWGWPVRPSTGSWTVRVLESFTLAGRRRVRRRGGVVHGDRARRHAGVAGRVPGRQPGGATAGPGRAPDLAARLAGRPPGRLRPGGRPRRQHLARARRPLGTRRGRARWRRRSARRG